MITCDQVQERYIFHRDMFLLICDGICKNRIGEFSEFIRQVSGSEFEIKINLSPWMSVIELNSNVIEVTPVIEYLKSKGISVKYSDGRYKSLNQLIQEFTEVKYMRIITDGSDNVCKEEDEYALKCGNASNGIIGNGKLWDFCIQGSVTTKVNIADVNIIVPNKVVEVTFSDGSKEKAVCKETDTFTLEQAISICIGKKLMGGSSAYNNAVKQGVKVYESKLKKEISELEEKERIARKKIKKLNYQKRRAARREEEEAREREAEKERQIEIQKEAYIRAMQCMNESKGSDVE